LWWSLRWVGVGGGGGGREEEPPVIAAGSVGGRPAGGWRGARGEMVGRTTALL
jgi:hypothetical protein